MPNRIIREGIITSVPVNSLTWGAEVFYRRLLNVADDYGRFHANTSLLRAYCFPLQLNKVSDSDVAKWLAETQKAGLVRVYSVDGEELLELEKFGQRVRAEKSKFKSPSDSCQSTDGHQSDRGKTAAHVVVDVVVDEDEGSAGIAPNGARHANDVSEIVITLPLREGGEFEVMKPLVAEVEPLCPAVDVPATLKEMKLWLVGNPDRRKTRKGIKRFITNWLKAEQEKHGR